MTTTMNISLPKEMHKNAKKLVAEGKYSSISELIRAGLRRTFEEADKITENGFPGWFEDQVLEAADEPTKNDTVLKTEDDIHRHFKKLHKKIEIKKKRKYGKGQSDWQVQSIAR